MEQQNNRVENSTEPHSPEVNGAPEQGQTADPSASGNEPVQQNAAHNGKTKLLLALGGVVIIAAAAYFYFMQNGNQVFNSMKGGDAVALVNGVGISEEDYDQSIASITNSAAQQGADTTDPQVQSIIKEEAITGLINNELLFQGSQEAGITIDDAAVQTEYDLIKENFGGEEALNLRMQELGFSEEEVREDIMEQLAINEYITAQVNAEDLSVTDEEVSAYYESLTAQGAELPPLADISEQIAAQLESQKQQEAVSVLIESLRTDAEIEILN